MAMCPRDQKLVERVSCWTTASEVEAVPAVPVQPAAWLAAFFLSNFRPAKAGQCEVEGENQKTCKGRH